MVCAKRDGTGNTGVNSADADDARIGQYNFQVNPTLNKGNEAIN